jgi:hypothetical protein
MSLKPIMLRITMKEYRKWLSWLRLMLLLAFSVSVFLTYQGLYLTIGERWLAMALSVFAGMVSWVMSAFLLEYFSRGNGPERAFLLRYVALPVGVMVCITSTGYATLSMASPQAIKLELQERTEEAQAIALKRTQEHQQEVRAVGILQVPGTEFGTLSKNEIDVGSLGGVAGEGKISNDLAAIGRGFEASATAVEAAQLKKHEAGKAAMKAVDGMRSVTESAQANDASIRSAQTEFAKHLRAFETAMGELRESSLPADVLAPVDAALELQKVSPLTAKEKNLDKQKAGATAAEALAQNARNKTQAALDEIRIDTAERQPLRMPSPMESVFEHWREVAYLGALPLVLDLGAPLVAIACLMFLGARLVPEPGGRTEQEFESDLEQVQLRVIDREDAEMHPGQVARSSADDRLQAHLERRKAFHERQRRQDGSQVGAAVPSGRSAGEAGRQAGFGSPTKVSDSQAEGREPQTIAGGGQQVRMAAGDFGVPYAGDAGFVWAGGAAPDLREYARLNLEPQEVQTRQPRRPTRLRTVTETATAEPASDPCRDCMNRPE